MCIGRLALVVSLALISYKNYSQPVHGSELSQTRELENYFLLLYSDSGKVDVVEYLLKSGIDPNITGTNGETALMYASQNGHLDAVNLLIRYGADVNTKPFDGNTALHAATRNNNDSIAEILILNGARINENSNTGVTPLHIAAGYGYTFLTKLLIFYGAHLNWQDHRGNTPLMAAVYFGSGRTSQILLANGAEPDIPDREGYTPLMVASQFNDTLLFNLLIAYGADPFAKNHNGLNSLALAIKYNANDVARTLIAMGADKEPFSDHKSYRQIAQLSGNRTILNFLNKQEPRSIIPKFGKLGVFTSTLQNQNDFYWGGGLSAFDINNGFEFSGHFVSRLISKAVLTDTNNEYYQFFEFRRLLSLSVNKPLAVKWLSGGRNYGLKAGISYLYSWANYNYNNARTKPYSFSSVSPSFGMYYQWGTYKIEFYGQIYNLLRKRDSIFWVGVNFGTEFDFTQPRVKRKVYETPM